MRWIFRTAWVGFIGRFVSKQTYQLSPDSDSNWCSGAYHFKSEPCLLHISEEARWKKQVFMTFKIVRFVNKFAINRGVKTYLWLSITILNPFPLRPYVSRLPIVQDTMEKQHLVIMQHRRNTQKRHDSGVSTALIIIHSALSSCSTPPLILLKLCIVVMVLFCKAIWALFKGAP